MGLQRIAISNPSANTDTKIFTAGDPYLLSIIATNKSASAGTISVWVQPNGASAESQYAFIVYNLPVDGNNSYETFRFAINALDEVYVRSTSSSVNFQAYGLAQYDIKLGAGVSSYSPNAPANPVNGMIWVDSDGTVFGSSAKPIYVYNSATGTWQSTAASGIDTAANYNFTGTIGLPSTTSIGNVSSAEIGYIDGVTSSIQTQLNTKAPLASPTFTGTVSLPSATSIGDVSSTEISYLDGVTSSIQTQLNNRVLKSGANYALSNATAITVNSGTPTTVASATITTNGRPILIIATGDGNPTNAGDWNWLRIYRDSTAIGKSIIFQTSNASHNHAFAQTTIDVPTTGTYTYTLKAWAGQGTMTYGETGNDQAPTLICIELF